MREKKRKREWGRKNILEKYRKEHFFTISRVQLKFMSIDKYVSVGK